VNTEKKRVLVTGATGGIGSPLALHLASKGYDLILTARSEKNLSELTKSIKKAFPERTVDYSPSDFSKAESFEKILKLVGDSGVSGLVLMPPQPDPTTECFPDDVTWQRIFKESFIGPVGLIRALIPELEKRVRSKVVLISGISSLQVFGNYSTSSVLRLMWVGQMKTLALAYGPKRIHFNTLSLGGVLTDEYMKELKADAANEKTSIDALLEKEVANVPLRKYAATNEVATAVEGLLSSFTDHITGWNIPCDGGFTRAY